MNIPNTLHHRLRYKTLKLKFKTNVKKVKNVNKNICKGWITKSSPTAEKQRVTSLFLCIGFVTDRAIHCTTQCCTNRL